jgi:hypothetical protein
MRILYIKITCLAVIIFLKLPKLFRSYLSYFLLRRQTNKHRISWKNWWLIKQLFDFFSIFLRNYGYLKKSVFWFLRTMVMNLKKHPDNHWGLFQCWADIWIFFISFSFSYSPICYPSVLVINIYIFKSLVITSKDIKKI